MLIPINDELKNICRQIADNNYTEKQWSEHESDDMFQTDAFEGGYDEAERAFTFSYFDKDDEYWFRLPLGDVNKINQGLPVEIRGRSVDD